MQRLTLLSTVSLFAVALAVGACSRHDDDRAITAAPDLAAPSSAPETRGPPPTQPSPGTAANPLAMQLKHDGPPSASASATPENADVDPCAPPERTGPMAMRLRHDGPSDAGQRNPLCMRIK